MLYAICFINLLFIDYKELEYQLPYLDDVPKNPNPSHMFPVVFVKGIRPSIPKHWRSEKVSWSYNKLPFSPLSVPLAFLNLSWCSSDIFIDVDYAKIEKKTLIVKEYKDIFWKFQRVMVK